MHRSIERILFYNKNDIIFQVQEIDPALVPTENIPDSDKILRDAEVEDSQESVEFVEISISSECVSSKPSSNLLTSDGAIAAAAKLVPPKNISVMKCFKAPEVCRFILH